MSGTSNMTNLNAQEKSRGVVLFARNTDTVDYVKIAEHCSQLIKHTLNLPVSIITTDDLQTNIRTGYKHGSQWLNGGRYRAYELSPYDETILIDSDYLILDCALLKVLDTVDDYRIMAHNQSPKQSMDGSMGVISLNYVWATAIVFKKTSNAKLLFDLVGRIERNYEYYKKLYNLREFNFRNDYAFAIADNIINGYNSSPGIPWTMLTIENIIKQIEIKDNKLIIREQESAHVVPVQSVHIMDKDYLLSEQYKEFVDTVCQN
jgi:hypothetical protein